MLCTFNTLKENKWKNFGQEDALKLVGNIFQCNFNGKFMKGYLRHVKEMWNLALHSPYMVDNCHIKPKCLDDKTLHFKKICIIFQNILYLKKFIV